MALHRRRGQDQGSAAADPMVPPPSASPRPGPPSGDSAWNDAGRDRRTVLLLALPLTLSTALLVLFLVVLHSQQQQASRIGELLQRLQSLEQSRALERTAVLEQQLRAMLARLQQLERQEGSLQRLEQRLQSLEQNRERPLGPPVRPRLPLQNTPPRLLPPLPGDPQEPLMPDRTLPPLPEEP